MQDNWHILIVEDDPDIHEMLAEKMRSAGYEAQNVYDAQSALEVIEREGLPHLAVIDIKLPDSEMDGLDLAKNLYERNVPIIIITAYDSPDTVLDSLKVADDYVRKPFEPTELVARIR